MHLCKDKVLIKSREGNFIVFKSFKNDKVNEYYIYLDSGNYKFQRDTIQYKSDIISFKSSVGTPEYKDEVCRYVESISKELASFGINGFRTDFIGLGEPFKFYLKNGKTVVYIPDFNKISMDENYRKSLKPLGDFWYYTE